MKNIKKNGLAQYFSKGVDHHMRKIKKVLRIYNDLQQNAYEDEWEKIIKQKSFCSRSGFVL